jgi:C-terminal processing protease CtpA/Prc
MVSLGRLWATIKYFHPYLASRSIDWDSALVATVPRAQASTTRGEFVAAIEGMLAALGDPATRVAPEGPAVSRPSDPDPHCRMLPGRIWLISLHNYGDLQDLDIIGRLQVARDSIAAARGVVIDIRTDATGDDPTAMAILAFAGLDRALVSRPLRAPGQRGRFHSGLASRSGVSSGVYFAGTYTIAGNLTEPADTGGPGTVVFVVNERSLVPPVALALQDAGLGRIVADSAVSDAPAIAPRMQLLLADSVEVAVRTTELVHADGRLGFVPDTVVVSSSGANDPALAVAAAWAATPPPSGTASSPRVSESEPVPERDYADSTYPSLPLRVLAAYRMWAAMEFFYPYRRLMDRTPTELLQRFLPEIERAGDSLAYALAVSRMWAGLHDGHGWVEGPVIDRYFGDARPAVRLRWIEGRPVVVQLSPDSAARAAGIAVGDEIVAVEDEPVERLVARIRPLISASTPQASNRYVASSLLLGPDSSRVRVTVRGASGRPRTVSLTRSRQFRGGSIGGRDGPIIRRLPGGIGYVDLDRLTNGMVDSMFATLGDTRAIIFDERGYPHGTAWTIAPRLTDRAHVPAAAFYRMQPMPRDTADRTVFEDVQTLPSALGPRYRGATVMLIDERTQSQAEHTGLFFKAANGTLFVGTPTSGADGDVVSFTVPGGITLTFSGQGVTWPDGRQLQRVGLKPDVVVRPTLAGIRAGRDEVLDRAVAWVRANVPAPVIRSR